MEYRALLLLSIILLVGFILGKVMERIKIPEITGYIIAGILLGPSVFNVISASDLESIRIIMNIVLGIIAYSIGTELWIPKLKKNGKRIVITTLFESLTTTVVVLSVMLLFGQDLWLSLLLAAIATATAPAAAMAIAKKLKAKGPVTDVALPVIGLDDITAVLVFGIFSSLAINLISGNTGETNILILLGKPLLEVLISIVIGSVLGLILGLLSRYVFSRMEKKERYLSYLVVVLAFILFIIWFTHFIDIQLGLHISALLTPLAMGMVFTNLANKESFEIQSAALHNFSGPFTILLFTMAGVELSLDVLIRAGLPALLYVVFRSIGKIGGAWLGGKVCKSPKIVTRNVGFMLLPQGGVEIGMIVAVMAMIPESHHDKGILVQTIVLAGILVFELVGPVLFKNTIIRVKEDTINRPVKDGEQVAEPLVTETIAELPPYFEESSEDDSLLSEQHKETLTD